MISVGTDAPDFDLKDQFGRSVRSSEFKGKMHTMLLFYPLDFTPTWSREVPALEALLAKFKAANTQPLGVSVDSLYSHANWASSMGGISYPLLADFHPKGAVAEKFGLYLGDKGISDRATVIVDAAGKVQYVKSVTPGGERDMNELLSECERINSTFKGHTTSMPQAEGVSTSGQLFIKDNCGFSRAAQLALSNLHLSSAIKVLNVSKDASAMAKLRELTGKEQAPCLAISGSTTMESQEIVRRMVTAATGWWA